MPVSMKPNRTAAHAAVALMVSWLSMGIAVADTLSWRLSTVAVTMEAGETVRKGVALFSNGQPAIVTVRLRPTAQPAQGSMPFATVSEYRFEDGSSFTVRGQGVTKMSPEGVPLPGETRINGQFIEGSGRYTGISGTVTVRSVSGLNRTTDGILGDGFGDAVAEYTLPR